MKVKINTDGLDTEEQIKVHLAGQYLESVVNNPMFKDFVLNYKYEVGYYIGMLWWRKYYTKQQSKFTYTNLNNRQVWNKFISGAETLSPEADNEMDIYIKVDRRNRRGVIGYTYPASKFQWIYSWVLKKFSVEQIAGNIVHEWLHKIGFEHPFNRTIYRPFSVPYAIGDMVANFNK